MTTGELLFCSGVALLALTMVLAIIFAKKKPRYQPENVAPTDGRTALLRSGYPTNPMTIRREPPERTGSVFPEGKRKEVPNVTNVPLPGPETAPLEEKKTPILQDTVPLPAQETVPLSGKDAPASRETSRLPEGTEPLSPATESLETEILS